MRTALLSLALLLTFSPAFSPAFAQVDPDEDEIEKIFEELFKGGGKAAAPKVEDPADRLRAMELQDYGVPPRLYIEDPASVAEAQATVSLYSLEEAKPTAIGKGFLEALNRAKPETIQKLTRKRVSL